MQDKWTPTLTNKNRIYWKTMGSAKKKENSDERGLQNDRDENLSNNYERKVVFTVPLLKLISSIVTLLGSQFKFMGQSSPLALVWPGIGTLNNDPTNIMRNRGSIVFQMKTQVLLTEARNSTEGTLPAFY